MTSFDCETDLFGSSKVIWFRKKRRISLLAKSFRDVRRKNKFSCTLSHERIVCSGETPGASGTKDVCCGKCNSSKVNSRWNHLAKLDNISTAALRHSLCMCSLGQRRASRQWIARGLNTTKGTIMIQCCWRATCNVTWKVKASSRPDPNKNGIWDLGTFYEKSGEAQNMLQICWQNRAKKLI